VDDVRDLLDRKRRVVEIQHRSIHLFVHVKYEVVVCHNHAIGVERILCNRMVGSPLAEFGHEIDVFNVMPVVLKPMKHLVFDVLVEGEPIRHRSVIGWRESGIHD